MNEDFLHFIWKNKLWNPSSSILSNGESVEVIAVGLHNTNAGPDFTDARIKIGNTIWAGNVEIHYKSSLWNVHKHSIDKAYDNVILHVVFENDTTILRSDGQQIPCFVMKFDSYLEDNYNSLIKSSNLIACADKLVKNDPFIINQFITSKSYEKLSLRNDKINEILEKNSNDWDECLYQLISRYLGFGVNSEPFELLAKSIPLKILLKNIDNHHKIYALLFGVAGMLNDTNINDDFYLNLYNEYKHLQYKYNLQTLDKSLFKFLRIRPVNFPTIRIAQLCELIIKQRLSIEKIVNTQSLAELEANFMIEPYSYWESHYTFGKESKHQNKRIGKTAIDLILINAVIPFMFAYARYKSNTELEDRALQMLSELEPEDNTIIRSWGKLGIKAQNAMESQALLHIYNEYCLKKRCLTCSIGCNTIKLLK